MHAVHSVHDKYEVCGKLLVEIIFDISNHTCLGLGILTLKSSQNHTKMIKITFFTFPLSICLADLSASADFIYARRK